MKRLVSLLLLLAPALQAGNIKWDQVCDVPVKRIENARGTLPPFTFWQKVYQTKGRSSFRVKMFDKTGKIVAAPACRDVLDKKSAKAAVDGVRSPRNIVRFQEESPSYHSKNGVLTVKIIREPSFKAETGMSWYLSVSHPSHQNVWKVPMPEYDWNPSPLGIYGAKTERFYFLMTCCSTTDRAFDLFQYDPKDSEIIKIANTNGNVFPSPDGRWLIWETGRRSEEMGGKEYWTTILVAYDMEEQVNYVVTEGTQLDLFNKWVK